MMRDNYDFESHPASFRPSQATYCRPTASPGGRLSFIYDIFGTPPLAASIFDTDALAVHRIHLEWHTD